MLEGEEQEIAPMYDPGDYGAVQGCLQGIKEEWEIPFPILTERRGIGKQVIGTREN